MISINAKNELSAYDLEEDWNYKVIANVVAR